jgi:hypothetical protein
MDKRRTLKGMAEFEAVSSAVFAAALFLDLYSIGFSDSKGFTPYMVGILFAFVYRFVFSVCAVRKCSKGKGSVFIAVNSAIFGFLALPWLLIAIALCGNNNSSLSFLIEHDRCGALDIVIAVLWNVGGFFLSYADIAVLVLMMISAVKLSRQPHNSSDDGI